MASSSARATSPARPRALHPLLRAAEVHRAARGREPDGGARLLSTRGGGGPTPRRRAPLARPSARRRSDVGRRPTRWRSRGRVLSAADRDGSAQQAEFAGRFHGAFTWALTSTLEQWKAVQQGGAAARRCPTGSPESGARAPETLSFEQDAAARRAAPKWATSRCSRGASLPQPTSRSRNVSPIPHARSTRARRLSRLHDRLEWRLALRAILVRARATPAGPLQPGTPSTGT